MGVATFKILFAGVAEHIIRLGPEIDLRNDLLSQDFPGDNAPMPPPLPQILYVSLGPYYLEILCYSPALCVEKATDAVYFYTHTLQHAILCLCINLFSPKFIR